MSITFVKNNLLHVQYNNSLILIRKFITKHLIDLLKNTCIENRPIIEFIFRVIFIQLTPLNIFLIINFERKNIII